MRGIGGHMATTLKRVMNVKPKQGIGTKGVYTFFAAPIICFTLGCGFVAYGLAKSLPTSSSPFPSVIYLPAAK
jgi:hypothetical protein